MALDCCNKYTSKDQGSNIAAFAIADRTTSLLPHVDCCSVYGRLICKAFDESARSSSWLVECLAKKWAMTTVSHVTSTWKSSKQLCFYTCKTHCKKITDNSLPDQYRRDLYSGKQQNTFRSWQVTFCCPYMVVYFIGLNRTYRYVQGGPKIKPLSRIIIKNRQVG